MDGSTQSQRIQKLSALEKGDAILFKETGLLVFIQENSSGFIYAKALNAESTDAYLIEDLINKDIMVYKSTPL